MSAAQSPASSSSIDDARGGPLVSVVVTTRNRAEHLPRLLEALEGQNARGRIDFELIVVDNRSTDCTAEILQSYCERACWSARYVLEEQPGKSWALNRGVTLARGAFIAFTDDDAVPAADWIDSIVRYFEAHPDVACIGGRVELFDSLDARITVRLSRVPASYDLENLKVGNIPVIGCNLAIRAKMLRAVGPFDIHVGPGSRVGSGDDVDMLYRIARAGGRIDYLPDLLVLHNHGRRSQDSVSAVLDKYLIGRGGFYCKYFLRRDRRVLRWAYWEVSGFAKQWLCGVVISKPARNAGRSLVLLGRGFARYLTRTRCLPGAGGSEDIKTRSLVAGSAWRREDHRR